MSGAACPALGGLLGSQRSVLRSVHFPDQSGYFHCAWAPPLATPSRAASVSVRIALRTVIDVLPRMPPRNAGPLRRASIGSEIPRKSIQVRQPTPCRSALVVVRILWQVA